MTAIVAVVAVAGAAVAHTASNPGSAVWRGSDADTPGVGAAEAAMPSLRGFAERGAGVAVSRRSP